MRSVAGNRLQGLSLVTRGLFSTFLTPSSLLCLVNETKLLKILVVIHFYPFIETPSPVSGVSLHYFLEPFLGTFSWEV